MGTSDAQLSALIAVLKSRQMATGVEVGGTAWSNGYCTLNETLA